MLEPTYTKTVRITEELIMNSSPSVIKDCLVANLYKKVLPTTHTARVTYMNQFVTIRSRFNAFSIPEAKTLELTPELTILASEFDGIYTNTFENAKLKYLTDQDSSIKAKAQNFIKEHVGKEVTLVLPKKLPKWSLI